MTRRISRDLKRRHSPWQKKINEKWKDFQCNGWWERGYSKGWKNIFSIIWKQGYRWLLIWHFCPDWTASAERGITYSMHIVCTEISAKTRRKTTISTASGERGILDRFLSNSRILLKKKIPIPMIFPFEKRKVQKFKRGEKIDLPTITRKFCHGKNRI